MSDGNGDNAQGHEPKVIGTVVFEFSEGGAARYRIEGGVPVGNLVFQMEMLKAQLIAQQLQQHAVAEMQKRSGGIVLPGQLPPGTLDRLRGQG